MWSPGALGPLLRVIDSARRSLDVENEEMADPDVESALEADARRGVDVRVVMTNQSTWAGAFTSLSAAGVHVRTYAANAGLYIHAKLILADGHTVFVGSQNFSAGSLKRNRELGIITSAPAIIASLKATFNADDAGATPFVGSGASASPPTSSPSSSGSAGCTVRATFDARYDDWDVDVHSGYPDQTVTVSVSGGVSASWHTDASGYADVYLKAPQSAAGEKLTARVGSATCTATL